MCEDAPGRVIECYEHTPVVECEQDSAYEDEASGGSIWNQNDWHGFWPGFGSARNSANYNFFNPTFTPDDGYNFQGEKVRIPRTLTLSNGDQIQIEFGITQSDNKNADQNEAKLHLDGNQQ
ncbi:hypothetical protein [Algoriphagus namhaensis]